MALDSECDLAVDASADGNDERRVREAIVTLRARLPSTPVEALP